MEESNIWIISVTTLLIGVLIGALIGYFASRSNEDSGEQEQLAEAKQELENYKAQVASHFKETATLVNKMTESYHGVYTHLASSAQTLCDADTARVIESNMMLQQTTKKKAETLASENLTHTHNTNDTTDTQAIAYAEPPRDYAPKKPDQEGTLSESYGLDEQPNTPHETSEKATPDQQEVIQKPDNSESAKHA